MSLAGAPGTRFTRVCPPKVRRILQTHARMHPTLCMAGALTIYVDRGADHFWQYSLLLQCARHKNDGEFDPEQLVGAKGLHQHPRNLLLRRPGINEGLTALHTGGTPPRFVIIDDGWQCTDVDPNLRAALTPADIPRLEAELQVKLLVLPP